MGPGHAGQLPGAVEGAQLSDEPLAGLDPTSNRQAVRQKVAAYLERGRAEGSIQAMANVFAHPPKLTKQSDLFDNKVPGDPAGGVIFMYLANQGEFRIALGGTPQRGVLGSGGRKGRVYSLSLLCYFIWKGQLSEEADAANDKFIDSLTSWIELDRNAGCGDVSNGGDGSGVIFSWGEGPDPSSVPGGKDIVVHTAFPRDIRGQGVQIFNVVDVAVISMLGT